MNITSKSRYALKIMMDLAEHAEVPVVHRGDIAARQGIPLDYMDHILSRLREGGLIDSTRGRGGGYRLVRAPEGISALTIFTVVEDAFQPVQCLEGGTGCVAEHVCSSKDAWGLISGAIRDTLSGIMLTDLVANKAQAKSEALAGPLAALSQECRAPKRRAGGGSK
jgi:Rrf2 family protein